MKLQAEPNTRKLLAVPNFVDEVVSEIFCELLTWREDTNRSVRSNQCRLVMTNSYRKSKIRSMRVFFYDVDLNIQKKGQKPNTKIRKAHLCRLRKRIEQ